MANNNDTKFNTVEDGPNSPNQQPPPPYSDSSDENTLITDTEQTQLPGRAVVASYTSPYTPTQNLVYNPPTNNDNRSYYQHPQTVILSPVVNFNPPTNNDNRSYYQHPQTVMPQTVMLSPQPVVNLTALRTMPAMTVCPQCQRTVLSIVRYESGGCTWLSCAALACCVPPFCFIPFFVTELKDAIHSCSSCGKIMAKYCRLDGTVYAIY